MTEEKKMLFSQDALKKLLWPLIIEQFLAIAMGMADTVMAASCGEAVVSSVVSAVAAATDDAED